MKGELVVARDFSRTPGSRYRSEGDFSGEEFRTSVLLPRLLEAMAASDELVVDLDGTAGFGTSFLEEAFGGLIRDDGCDLDAIRRVLKLKSLEEPYLIDDVVSYMEDAFKRRGTSR